MLRLKGSLGIPAQFVYDGIGADCPKWKKQQIFYISGKIAYVGSVNNGFLKVYQNSCRKKIRNVVLFGS